jgi:hypothetical protein
MNFGSTSNPLEISNMKMNMIWNRLVAEKKESIWRKKIED